MRTLSDYFQANPSASVEVTSYGLLRDIFVQLERTDYIFRGLRSANYGLETSFERSFYGWYNKEEELIQKFSARMHQFLRQEEIPKTKLETLATMQHHGIPTRLLDFTRSFYIASYFACRDQGDEPSSILAVNVRNLMTLSLRNLRGAGIDFPIVYGPAASLEYLAIGNHFFDDRVFNEVVATNEHSAIGVSAPFKQNLRLSRQQGLFLFSFKLNQPFEHSFMELMMPVIQGHLEEAKGGEDGTLQKFVIPGRLKKEIMQELRRMNINAETLFGGLDGYALSVKEEVESQY